MSDFAEWEFAAERDGGGFNQERSGFRAAGVGHAADPKLFEELFNDALEIGNVELRLALAAAPERRTALARERDGDMPLLVRSADRRVRVLLLVRASFLGEHAPTLKQRHVVILAREVVP